MAKDRTKNRYVGPQDIQFAVFGVNIGGGAIAFPVLADLPEGAFINWTTGDNPIALPEPGPHLKAGSMVLMVPPELAAHIRKEILDSWDKAQTVDISDITGG